MTERPFTIAVPKGRVLRELIPYFADLRIKPERAFFDPEARQLKFRSLDDEHPATIIRVRSFDVATFVAFGAADLGIVGDDVLLEHQYDEIYAPLNLGIGACRMVVASQAPLPSNRIRIATKYPRIAETYFTQQGIDVECLKLQGAVELAPLVGMCHGLVDISDTGRSLAEHNLVTRATIATITTHLIVNRTRFKTDRQATDAWIERFRVAFAPPPAN